MAKPKINGSDKAALVLLALGEEVSAEIFKRLSQDEVKKITGSLSRLGRVSDSEIAAVLAEFSNLMSSPGGAGITGSGAFAERVVRLAFKGEQSAALEAALARGTEPQLSSVEMADAETIAAVMSGEHPQTVALVIAHASPSKAAAVVRLLPEHKRTDLLIRIASLEPVDPETISELDDYLREAFDRTQIRNRYRVGGAEHVARMLGALPDDDRRQQLDSISGRDPAIAQKIEELLFTFDDVARLDLRNMQELIKQVPNDDLLVAMKGAKRHVLDSFLSALSERARTRFSEDLEALGPKKKSDVEMKQREITSLLKRLIEEGKITIQDKDDVYV